MKAIEKLKLLVKANLEEKEGSGIIGDYLIAKYDGYIHALKWVLLMIEELDDF